MNEFALITNELVPNIVPPPYKVTFFGAQPKNSQIIKKEGSIVLEEGCLSVPDIRADIERPETITLRYQDLYQNFHEKTFEGLISRVIQHELDHLQGKLFIDYLSPAKRVLINKRLLEISENGSPSTGIIL